MTNCNGRNRRPKPPSKEKRRARKQRIKTNMAALESAERQIILDLAALGLELRSSEIRSGKSTKVPHLMIEDAEGRRVLDCWPSTLRWRYPATGEGGHLGHIREVVGLAARLFVTEAYLAD